MNEKKGVNVLKQKVQDALNQQIVREMFSSNLYLSMAAFYNEKNLAGFANWMHIQAQEEMQHALKFFDYIIDRGGKVVISEIKAPQSEWPDIKKPFADALEHEQLISQHINDLADLAISEKDHATSSFLQWFIDEQVEEEATTSEIVERLDLVGDSKGAMFMMDNELKSRQLGAEE